MNKSIKDILVGILTSFFLTPFLGSSLTGYLAGTDIRKGIISGGIVGAVVGLIVGGAVSGLAYVNKPRPAAGQEEIPEFLQYPGTGTLEFWAPILLLLLGVLLASVIMGIIGGGLGSYVQILQQSHAREADPA